MPNRASGSMPPYTFIECGLSHHSAGHSLTCRPANGLMPSEPSHKIRSASSRNNWPVGLSVSARRRSRSRIASRGRRPPAAPDGQLLQLSLDLSVDLVIRHLLRLLALDVAPVLAQGL